MAAAEIFQRVAAAMFPKIEKKNVEQLDFLDAGEPIVEDAGDGAAIAEAVAEALEPAAESPRRPMPRTELVLSTRISQDEFYLLHSIFHLLYSRNK